LVFEGPLVAKASSLLLVSWWPNGRAWTDDQRQVNPSVFGIDESTNGRIANGTLVLSRPEAANAKLPGRMKSARAIPTDPDRPRLPGNP